MAKLDVSVRACVGASVSQPSLATAPPACSSASRPSQTERGWGWSRQGRWEDKGEVWEKWPQPDVHPLGAHNRHPFPSFSFFTLYALRTKENHLSSLNSVEDSLSKWDTESRRHLTNLYINCLEFLSTQHQHSPK